MGLEGKRIGLVTASASRLGGGVFEAVVLQASIIRDLGATPVVISLRDEYTDADTPRFDGAPCASLPVIGPRQIGVAPHLATTLAELQLDCAHLHGIWMFPSYAIAEWSRRTGRPYAISPHGMLDPWITSRGRWKKALARLGYERRNWQTASRFHALTDGEARDISRETGRHDLTVIPNPGPPAVDSPSVDREPMIVFMGRIHPKKNLLALVRAWQQLPAGDELPAEARLIIAGWGAEGDVALLRSAMTERPRGIQYVGPVFGEEKARLLAAARFAILPSHSEGLPMAVLEAWAHGTPTLMSENCNLPIGFEAGSALDCGTEPDTIGSCIKSALTLSSAAWRDMQTASLKLAMTQFSRSRVARDWEAFYEGLIGEKGPLQ